MKIIISAETLRKVVGVTASVVDSRNIVPEKDSLLFSLDRATSALSVYGQGAGSGCDLQKSTPNLEVVSSEEPISFLLDAKKAVEASKGLAGEVELEVDSEYVVKLKAGKQTIKLKALAAGDVFDVRKRSDYEFVYNLDVDEIKRLTASKAFMKKESYHSNQSGMYVNIDADYVTTVVTDGFRLAECKVRTDEKEFKKPVSFRLMEEGVDMLRKLGVHCFVGVHKNLRGEIDSVAFSNNETLLTAPVIIGDYVNYGRVLGKDSNHISYPIDLGEVKSAVKSAGILSPERGSLFFDLVKDKVVVRMYDEEGQSFSSVLDGNYISSKYNAVLSQPLFFSVLDYATGFGGEFYIDVSSTEEINKDKRLVVFRSSSEEGDSEAVLALSAITVLVTPLESVEEVLAKSPALLAEKVEEPSEKQPESRVRRRR